MKMLKCLYLLLLWFILIATWSIGYLFVGLISVTLAIVLSSKLSSKSNRDFFKFNLNKQKFSYFFLASLSDKTSQFSSNKRNSTN